MILNAESPIGFVPVWKKDEVTGEYAPSDQPLNIDQDELHGLYNALKSKYRYQQDLVICIDGDEGSGKSVGGTQKAAVCAAIMSKLTHRVIKFTHEHITYDSQELIDMALNLREWQPILIDESKEIANRKRSMGKDIVKLENFLSECRALHKIIIIILPKIQDLTAYLSEHRIKMCYHYFHRFNKKSRVKQPGWYFVHGEENCKLIGLAIRKGHRNWYPRSKLPVKHGQKYSCVDAGALDKKKFENIKRYASDAANKPPSMSPAEIRKLAFADIIARETLIKKEFNLTLVQICAILGISDTTYYDYKRSYQS